MNTTNIVIDEGEQNLNVDYEMNDNNNNNDIYGNDFALKTWLNNINLGIYFDAFKKHGFADQIGYIQEITEQDLIDIGVDKVGHRRAILTHAKLLKQNSNVNGNMIVETEQKQNIEDGQIETEMIESSDDNYDQEDMLYVAVTKNTIGGSKDNEDMYINKNVNDDIVTKTDNIVTQNTKTNNIHGGSIDDEDMYINTKITDD
eukprot:280879_1